MTTRLNLEIFGAFPVLDTPRLRLRAMTPEDSGALLDVFGDDEVTRFYDVETMTEEAQAAAVIARMGARFADKLGIRWAIVDRADDRLMGSIGFNAISTWADRAALGYELARRAWGHGFATEAVREVVRFGHERMRLNRIEAAVMIGNEASVRVLRRVGFVEEGVLRAYGYWKGRYHDLRMFSIVRTDSSLQAV